MGRDEHKHNAEWGRNEVTQWERHTAQNNVALIRQVMQGLELHRQGKVAVIYLFIESV